LTKKLLQGELAMFKHEFEQKCQFIFEMTRRNEKAFIKLNQERDGISAKLQKV